MIPFHPPTLADRPRVCALLEAEGIPLCDYSFPVLFCWQGAYGFQIAELGERLLIRLRSSLGPAYLWPAGEGDPAPALAALTEDAHAQGEPLRLIALGRYHRNWLEAAWPGRFAFEDARDGADYLYSVEKLATLRGKRLQAKRNHLHRFDDACPGWTAAPFGAADLADCLAMDRAWYEEAKVRETPGSLTSLGDEHRALRLALEHWQELELEGVVLRWRGEPIAFSLGAMLTDEVFDVHFERARGDIQGSYAAVNRAFAQQILATRPEVRYLDREDDMGVPGLRKAKLSYQPDYLEENLSAVETAWSGDRAPTEK